MHCHLSEHINDVQYLAIPNPQRLRTRGSIMTRPELRLSDKSLMEKELCASTAPYMERVDERTYVPVDSNLPIAQKRDSSAPVKH